MAACVCAGRACIYIERERDEDKDIDIVWSIILSLSEWEVHASGRLIQGAQLDAQHDDLDHLQRDARHLDGLVGVL